MGITADSMLVTLTVSDLREIVRDEVKAALHNGNGHADPDKLLSVAEAAKIIGQSKMWLYRKSTKLPFAVRVGRSIKFSHKGIQHWIESQRRA
jgi:predicted DNA-binding transcriptional regulator AlpA